VLKQQVSRIKKVLAILLAVLFVVSVTSATVSAMDMKNTDTNFAGKTYIAENT
jgi:hypothetical protein